MNPLHLPLKLNESNGDILDARGFPVAEGCTDNGQLRQLVDLANRPDGELDRFRDALQWIARIPCKENPPCSSRADYACDSCIARAAISEKPIRVEEPQ